MVRMQLESLLTFFPIFIILVSVGQLIPFSMIAYLGEFSPIGTRTAVLCEELLSSGSKEHVNWTRCSLPHSHWSQVHSMYEERSKDLCQVIISCPSVCLSVSLSVSLSVNLSVNLSVSLSLLHYINQPSSRYGRITITRSPFVAVVYLTLAIGLESTQQNGSAILTN